MGWVWILLDTIFGAYSFPQGGLNVYSLDILYTAKMCIYILNYTLRKNENFGKREKRKRERKKRRENKAQPLKVPCRKEDSLLQILYLRIHQNVFSPNNNVGRYKGCQKSLGGYLIAFLTIFLAAASPRSMPHISANLIRYSSTSDNSSPRCSLSESSQFGKPLSTSPLHWNISDSSPTSPTFTHHTTSHIWVLVQKKHVQN